MRLAALLMALFVVGCDAFDHRPDWNSLSIQEKSSAVAGMTIGCDLPSDRVSLAIDGSVKFETRIGDKMESVECVKTHAKSFKGVDLRFVPMGAPNLDEWNRMTASEKSSWLWATATGCGLPSDRLRLTAEDEIVVRPGANDDYAKVDCMVSRIMALQNVPTSFVGNEAYVEERN